MQNSHNFIKQNAVPIKLTIRIPARSPTVTSACSPPSVHRNQSVKFGEMPYVQCSTISCGRYLPLTHEDGLCIWCRLTQKWQRERTACQENQSSTPSTTTPSAPLPKTPPLTGLINKELLSGDVVAGARICTSCQHILPPFSEYPYSTCYPCQPGPKQQSTTNVLVETAPNLTDEGMGDTVLDIENTSLDPQSGRCRNGDCGVIVHGQSECWQCTTRRMGVRRKQGVEGPNAGITITTGEPGQMKGSPETSCSKRQRSHSVNIHFILPLQLQN